MVLSAVLAACDRKKAVSEVDYADDSVIDSLFDSPDSLIFSSGSSDEELPKRADELFDDFIFEFARLKKVQLERVDCTGRYGVAHGEAVEIRIAFHEPGLLYRVL